MFASLDLLSQVYRTQCPLSRYCRACL